ncbi:hypothetical protein E6P09_00550 [Haloferax mediterranei ATCC 33500]|uniref:DUF7982 domain-containing protein n=1 Tax=Haloferax mediterranei (strain ATCC 33500 / DSM 1411 / JCM 8866 / NBRC 14739 / NCIMB 2177 / R-4) TaxID=523841 RepID=I3R6Q7_HALMT|nr:hypothetical protein [Haloferax mediterranei]AFK19917.1 hypothetical protein HFX_2228 [Haloferax mediterranei ATCC 33500]AHZ23296.1 hypothetical protein BM92_11885 [Haloferax mediterranei ATCC 33500]ELZ99461.1 hypothetical protein C439_12944 [Haloferax mediterranei ATCC 33500]MDX5987334.1 hypothetical protein [Haloferax mediterranei ATCC 33500]QCQ73849.1 hypothetical protein E6P09_00550 [Haloferax mediterranei ATCC 33500]
MSVDKRNNRKLANGQSHGPVSSPTQGSSDTENTSELAALRRENARLRQRYDSLRQSQYRQATAVLAALGVAGVLGAALFPPVREVLVVLGAIGLFAAAVTRYLSPEQFIPVGIGSSVFQAHAANHGAIVNELGLQDTTVYVPDAERETVRLFVPEHRSYTLPDPDALRDTFVVTDDETQRGVTFTPSGVGLFDEFERSSDGPLGDDPTTLARQTTDALVELFELVETTTTETDAADGRLTVRVEGCRFASAETFDTPVASFLGVTVARGLDTPVTTEVTPGDETSFAVTCRWEVGDDIPETGDDIPETGGDISKSGDGTSEPAAGVDGIEDTEKAN